MVTMACRSDDHGQPARVPGVRAMCATVRFSLAVRLFVGPFYNFERSLFQMKAAGTQVILDVLNASEANTDYGLGD